MEGACYREWNSFYLSKHHMAFAFRVVGGGGGMSFDISRTASVNNCSFGSISLIPVESYVPSLSFSF